jgi:NifU-like protein involved in Fe-S cluster formation
MYSEKLLEHFENPRNVGVMEDADLIGEAGSAECGDRAVIYIKLDGDKIKDVSFMTFGCAAAIASSSILTEMVRGMTLRDAQDVTKDDIADALNGVPPHKMHCSLMAEDALKDAILKAAVSNNPVYKGK